MLRTRVLLAVLLVVQTMKTHQNMSKTDSNTAATNTWNMLRTRVLLTVLLAVPTMKYTWNISMLSVLQAVPILEIWKYTEFMNNTDIFCVRV